MTCNTLVRTGRTQRVSDRAGKMPTSSLPNASRAENVTLTNVPDLRGVSRRAAQAEVVERVSL
jgi:hypothetical protein